jgi:glycosyltransferase involved in cell wall biosynthesis
LSPEERLDDPIYLQRLFVSPTPFISYPRLQALSYYIGHHKPDIIESYGFWYQPADTSARYAKKNHIPFIFHPIYYENRVRQKPIWQLYKNTIGRLTFAAADAVVVISPFEQKLIEESHMPVKRFELIPPGIDVTTFETLAENPFKERSISGTILLTVSRISRAKGLQDIVRALPDIAKKIPDVALVVAGEDFGYAHSLLAIARQLGVESRVRIIGKLSDRELVGAYQHADIFVHTSYYEAFGIVLAEAMAAGLPVVARNTSAIPYVVPHDQAGLLFLTHDELVQSIITLHTTDGLKKRFGAYGKQYVYQNFTWDTSIKKLLALYEELKS